MPRRAALWLALFAALTAVGVWWAVRSSGLEWRHVSRFSALRLSTQLLLAALSLGLVAAEAVRFRVCGVLVGAPMSWRTALDATIANNFGSWISPGAILGEPAAMWAMARRGVPWDAAGLVAIGRAMSGLLLHLVVALALLALGLGPTLHRWILVPFVVGAALALAIVLALVAAACFPERASAWCERRRALRAMFAFVRDAIVRLAAFRRRAARTLPALLAVHALYYAFFVAILVVLLQAFGAEGGARVVSASIIYLAFTYVAPTPGGAGLSEAVAAPFFGALVAPDAAVLAVLLFRGLTFYLQIAMGVVYLPFLGRKESVGSAPDPVLPSPRP